MFLRKGEPGSDSYGHVWAHPNSVVEVDDDQAAELLAIADAGFTVVPAPATAEKDDDPALAVLEVDPDPHADASPAPAPHEDAPARQAHPAAPRKAAGRRRSE